VKLTPQLAAALVNLRNNADFKLFMGAVVEEVNAETDRALSTEGAQCHRAQGAALKMRDLYKTFAEAPAALEKFQQR
jgi:hypothetical protein